MPSPTPPITGSAPTAPTAPTAPIPPTTPRPRNPLVRFGNALIAFAHAVFRWLKRTNQRFGWRLTLALLLILPVAVYTVAETIVDRLMRH